jgi:protein involved in polysaccharide export with SLBB domain
MTTELPEIERLEIIELRPGDVLLVTVPAHVSRQEAEEIRTVFETKFPGRSVLVKPVDVTVEAVRDE